MSVGGSSVSSMYVLIGVRIPVNSHSTSEADFGTGSPAATTLNEPMIGKPYEERRC